MDWFDSGGSGGGIGHILMAAMAIVQTADPPPKPPPPKPYTPPAAPQPAPVRRPAAAAADPPRFGTPIERPRYAVEGPPLQLPASPNGIVNTGNQCYASALIQCLFATPELAESFALFAEDPHANGVIRALGALFNRMSRGKVEDNHAEEFKAQIDRAITDYLRLHPKSPLRDYKGKEQQDAYEYFSLVLENIIGSDHIFDHFFGFDICDERRCTGDHPPVTYHKQAHWRNYALQINASSLQGIVNRTFFQQEQIEAQCEYCLAPMGERKVFASFPANLILILGRRGHSIAGKDRTPVAYSEDLEIPGKNGTRWAYELYGVVYHFGGGGTGGHYVAAIKGHGTQRWFLVDDSHVTPLGDRVPVGTAQVQYRTVEFNKDAYMFFYRKIG
jgi:uncharacterized UBP type Zn finger protein